MTFLERHKLALEFESWRLEESARNNIQIALNPETFFAFLEINGYELVKKEEKDESITIREINAIKCERVNTYCAILEAIPVWYHNRKFKMQCGMYVKTDNICIRLVEEGEGPFCSLTVNISNLPPEQFALDTNNFPEAEIFCIANRIAKPTKKILTSGFANTRFINWNRPL